ncbi:MAG: hypothetical protein ACYTGQ_12440, partial [Planctomycetota bacterium]
ATACLLLGAPLFLTGCGSNRITVPLADATLNQIEVNLSAEKDSMNVSYTLDADVDQPTRIKLLPDTAVLMTSDKPQDSVRIVTRAGYHWIQLTAKGAYRLSPTFLTPLAPPDNRLSRAFSLTLPMSLTNQVMLTVPQTGLEVDSPTAIRFSSEENAKTTTAHAVVAPGGQVTFNWKPRERQARLEKTVFITDVTTLATFDTAHVQLYNNIYFQIAQGELKEIQVRIPQGMGVNQVTGPDLGTWRFDPTTSLLEARLNKGATGEYRLNLVTQGGGQGMPWDVDLALPVVENASRQRGSIGLAPNDKVYLQIMNQTQTMNNRDFLRQFQTHTRSPGRLPESAIRHAFRVLGADDRVTARVFAVKPELRTAQNSSFNVGDERVVLNTDYTINVTKAGVFSATMRLPAAYDIDALTAPSISHWDETIEDDRRVVQIHFRQKVIGAVQLKLTLSQPVAQLPPRLEVPRIELVDAIKHTGQIVVSTERGLKVSIAERMGVTELNPVDLGLRAPGVRVFKLLRPDWQLTLASDVVAPRTTVQFLHVARVTDAMVRHTHYLRFQMTQAGQKVFNVRVPDNTLGLVISGPDIANMKEIDPDQHIWRIELARKWLDQPWPLTLEYEKQYDMTTGQVPIEPVLPTQGDLFRGNVVIQTTDKVEIQTANIGAALQRSESRNIPRTFGAHGLSEAAFTFRTALPDYQLTLNAQRHSAAQQLQADVSSCHINTVVNEQGQTINQVNLILRVGDLRNLTTTLPQGARIWSLMVNNRSTEPSLTTDANNRQRFLIPVAQASSSELQVEVEFIYVLPQPNAWVPTIQNHEGPRFDLPLKNINWTFYLPDDLEYEEFRGTLSVTEESVRNPTLVRYDASTYQEQQVIMQRLNNQTALSLQQRGQQLVREGRQMEAKQALKTAYNYSFNDRALNEDTLVQLHRLNQQQAMVGLKSRRGYIRPNVGRDNAQLPASRDLSDEYTEDDAHRELNSLDKDDSKNLEIISGRIIQAQDAAAGHNVPLHISLALRGRKIEFTRSLQVSPNVPMAVNFQAEPIAKEYKTSNLAATASAFAALLLLFTLIPWVMQHAPTSTHNPIDLTDDPNPTLKTPPAQAPHNESVGAPLPAIEDAKIDDSEDQPNPRDSPNPTEPNQPKNDDDDVNTDKDNPTT